MLKLHAGKMFTINAGKDVEAQLLSPTAREPSIHMHIISIVFMHVVILHPAICIDCTLQILEDKTFLEASRCMPKLVITDS